MTNERHHDQEFGRLRPRHQEESGRYPDVPLLVTAGEPEEAWDEAEPFIWRSIN
ncbi:hypothetical protein [Streptacidiphilus jiangxiensis]|uniref:Uncharacterized protein n=1 Tax=Streptacidiphilus jiangxiensis TaxID=235985 RepID=A0A1H7JN64_STRJI|nr:hypothetical protein [Streptacidiphilus jiangxiensis]SEK75992.1 hypothetical protein SAMN05414137_103376 [Streptacidiphilus jiangxiensis]